MKKIFSILLAFTIVTNIFGAIDTPTGEIIASFNLGSSYGGELSTNMQVGNRYLSEYDTYGEYYLQILNTAKYWGTRPRSIHFDCQLSGYGSNSVYDLYVDCLSRNGSVISTTLLTHSSSDGLYSTDIKPEKNVYGFRLHHNKSTQITINIESATLFADGVAHKLIDNGMVIIYKDGMIYDIQGHRL